MILADPARALGNPIGVAKLQRICHPLVIHEEYYSYALYYLDGDSGLPATRSNQ
jgi:hypothetical protein